jgi:hypothetical protein
MSREKRSQSITFLGRKILVYGSLGILALGGAARAEYVHLEKETKRFAAEHAVPAKDVNAIQHALASAMLAESLGPEVARFLGDAKEMLPSGLDRPDSFKDQWNNSMGRGIAAHAKKSGRDLQELVLDAYKRGLLITNEARDPRVPAAWSAPPRPAYPGPGRNI